MHGQERCNEQLVAQNIYYLSERSYCGRMIDPEGKERVTESNYCCQSLS